MMFGDATLGFGLLNRLLARQEPVQLEAHGAHLRSVGRQIWVADRELVMAGGLRFPVRMIVVANDLGDLICYAPVALDAATVEALTGIGDVRWIVSPSSRRASFVLEYQRQFPSAQVLAVAPISGCDARIAAPHGGIGDCVETMVVSMRGDVRELVIYHDASETLVVSELLINIPAGSRGLQSIMGLNGLGQQAGHTWLQRGLLVRDREGLADFYRWALARPFVRIAMSHGEVIDRDAREVFYQTFHGYLAQQGAAGR